MKNSIGVFKATMIPVTLAALLANNEVFGNIVALVWLAWGLWKLFEAAIKGGAFD